MNDERRGLEQDCADLEEAVRKAFLLNLSAYELDQKKREAAAWQAAWVNWNTTLGEQNSQVQAVRQDPSASSKAG